MKWNAGYKMGTLPDRDLDPPDSIFYCEICGIATEDPASDRDYDVLCPYCWDKRHPDSYCKQKSRKSER